MQHCSEAGNCESDAVLVLGEGDWRLAGCQVAPDISLSLMEWVQMLTSVFNKCLEEGIFPDRWKRQKLVLIRKSTLATATDPSSFRPLGIIDSMGKLFERLILNRMKNVFEEEDNKGISAVQFGFRKRLSTHHA